MTTLADAYVEQRMRHVEQRMRHINATLRIGGWRNAWMDMWTYIGEAASYRWSTWMQCIADPRERLEKVKPARAGRKGGAT